RPPQRPVQPVPGTVSGEHATGSVRAVGGRREADDEHPRGVVAETGHRTAPVLLVGERGALLAGDLLAPLDQPRAAAALDDDLVELLDRARRRQLRLAGAHGRRA